MTNRHPALVEFRATGTIWVSFFCMSLGLGVLVVNASLPWWVSPLLSGLVFAGSMEFLLIGMLSSATPLATIAIATLFTNSRHIFYGLTYPLHNIRSRLGKIYGIYSLTDEAYALASASPKAYQSGQRLLWMAGGLHLSWIAGSTVGALLSSYFLADIPGLDFVMIALFAVLSLDVFLDNRDYLALTSAIGCALFAMLLFPQHMLITALSSYVILLFIRHRLNTKKTSAQK